MAADYNLMKGAYMAMGGHIPGYGSQTRSNLMSFTQGLFDTVEPIIQERANMFQNWADQELSRSEPMSPKEYRDLEQSYRIKKQRFLLGGPAEQGMLLSEMHKDHQEFRNLNSLKRKTASLSKDSTSGFADNVSFMGGPEMESLVKSMSGSPRRNKDGNLGYVVWDKKQGKEVFKTFAEINNWLDDWSRDPATAGAIEKYLKETGAQSMALPFSKNIYDWNSNYKDVATRIVKNGDLTTLNEYENAPGRVFKNDFMHMLQNMHYEDLGVEIEGAKSSDFLSLGQRDGNRLSSIIESLDPNSDGDDTKISKKDAEKIYEKMVEHEGLNQEYLSAYITNLGEQQWNYARNFRVDAPQEINSPAVLAGEGEYDDKGAPGKYKYKVIDGKWHTFVGDDWKDISGNKEAVDKLNEWYPKAITSDQADNMDNFMKSLSKENQDRMTQWWERRSDKEKKELNRDRNWRTKFNDWLVENEWDPIDTEEFKADEDSGDNKKVVNTDHFLKNKDSNLYKMFRTKFGGEELKPDNKTLVNFLNNNPDIKEVLEDTTLTDEQKLNKIQKLKWFSRSIYSGPKDYVPGEL